MRNDVFVVLVDVASKFPDARSCMCDTTSVQDVDRITVVPGHLNSSAFAVLSLQMFEKSELVS